MDPTTVLLYLVAGLGLSAGGVCAVVVSGSRAARRREARDRVRCAAVEGARWEARTEIRCGKACVRLVRVARLDGQQWVVQADDRFRDIPVTDSIALLDAQADVEVAARTANGDMT